MVEKVKRLKGRKGTNTLQAFLGNTDRLEGLLSSCEKS